MTIRSTSLGREHRTVLFIESSTNGDYRERANRLVESLNRSGDAPSGTIKVDVVEYEDEKRKSLVRYAKENGYTQALISVPVGGDK